VLLTGDAESVVLDPLARDGTLGDIDVLKVGHHGSRSASDPAWLAALQPEIALLTAGRHNSFEFPHPETLEALKACGCRSLWVVGPCSGVRLEALSEGWRVETGNGDRGLVP